MTADLDGLISVALGHRPESPALLVFDRRSLLARVLVDAYTAALPQAAGIDIDAAGPDAVLTAVSHLPAGALVVLIASTRIEVGPFRFRLTLFRLGLHVVEHPHLARIADAEIPVYVDALNYDPHWFRGMGAALRARLDPAEVITVDTSRGTLRYAGPFEPCRLNVGDYRGMGQVGGQFPIGEVFTEPVEVRGVSGRVALFAYGAADFTVAALDPLVALVIEGGRVVAVEDAPAPFQQVLDEIRAVEGEVWLRELGFGLNRAVTETRRVRDVSAYERMCGLHLSLGAKHSVYPKPGFNKRHTRYHVDVFVASPRVSVDGAWVFDRDRYVVEPVAVAQARA